MHDPRSKPSSLRELVVDIGHVSALVVPVTVKDVALTVAGHPLASTLGGHLGVGGGHEEAKLLGLEVVPRPALLVAVAVVETLESTVTGTQLLELEDGATDITAN